MLPPERSAALRDRLLGEIASFLSEEAMTAWARLSVESTLRLANQAG